MAPSGDEVLLLPVRNQVFFPNVRASAEVPRAFYDHVRADLQRLGATTVGLVLALPRQQQDARSAPGANFCKVGTYCRVDLNAAAPPAAGPGEQDSDTSDSVRVFLDGICRFEVLEVTQQRSPSVMARVRFIEDGLAEEDSLALRALVQSVRDKVSALVKVALEAGKPPIVAGSSRWSWPNSANSLVDVLGAHVLLFSPEQKQQLLETVDVRERLQLVLGLLHRELEAQQMQEEISANIQKARETELRQVIVQRQIQEVQRDLQKLRARAERRAEAPDAEGQANDDQDVDEVTRLSERLMKVGLTDDAMKIARKELRRLKSLQPHHPEYTSTQTYLELLASLPWRSNSEDCFDLTRARSVLDGDHRGLEKVKTRILEFLAVQKMRGNMRGPILCLHGPPGIGKTSLGRSIAKALGRSFHRVALGGVRDEAELRGHRRTYIGSIPGVLIQSLQTLGVNNPVILLDEVDKMAQNAMFNPQAALLEILDPEQNDSFRDHYLNTSFDLSKVLFICTANDTSLIDRPLLDRMEVIELSGYTVEEKMAITSTHLLPKQRQLHALEPRQEPLAEGAAPPVPAASPTLQLTDTAVHDLITKWTAESGVRNLERRLAQICRWTALRLQGVDVDGDTSEVDRDAARDAALAACGPHNGVITVDAQHLPHIVGVELYEPDIAERLTVGVAMGLSVSSIGGQLLFIEATRSAGNGRLTITGQLGKVMQESVETAMSLLRSRFVATNRNGAGGSAARVSSQVLDLLQSRRAPKDGADAAAGGAGAGAGAGVDTDPFNGEDIHVHFPAGGIPKDGPSAGVAVLLALASLLLNQPLRGDTAVTGEVTLRGHVLPVGGIRDKVLAAHRAGVRHVLLPLANKRHVEEEIPDTTLEGIQVHYLKHVDEALDWAFGKRGAGGAEALALHDAASSELPVPAVAAAGADARAPRSRL